MYTYILLSVDVQSEATWKKALPAAVQLAEAAGALLHVMTVVPDFGYAVVSQYFPKDANEQMIAEAEKALTDLLSRDVPAGLKTRVSVAQGKIYDEIIRTARESGADLIVMAAHRPELKDYLLGPNAARVVRHAKVSVLVVRD